MFKKAFWIILVISTAQFDAEAQIMYKAGAGWQKSAFVEAGVGIGYAAFSIGEGMFFYPSVTSEFHYNFSQKQFILAPEVGLDFAFLKAPIGGRLSTAFYTDFDGLDVRFVPEVGATIWTIVSLYYGYSVPLNNNEFAGIGKNKVSISFTFPRIN